MKRLLRAVAKRPWLVLLGVLLALAATARARPGGGGSFSSGSSGGGGGDDGIEFFIDLIILIVELCVDYPEYMLPALALAAVGFVAWRAAAAGGVVRWLLAVVAAGAFAAGCVWVPNFILVLIITLVIAAIIGITVAVQRKKAPDWNTATPAARSVAVAQTAETRRERRAEPSSARAALTAVRRRDPEFSTVLLQDYLYALYGEVQRARAAGQLGRLAPFLVPDLRQRLAGGDLVEIKDIVVGALRVDSGVIADDKVKLRVVFEVNQTEVRKGGQAQSWYLREQWRLSRRLDARSRPPARVSTFDCPNCGAALDAAQGSTCRFCKQVIDGGRLDWLVTGIESQERSERGPQLTSDVAEVGTDLPTVVDRDLAAATAALCARDPAFTVEGLQARVQVIFATFQKAWGARELGPMRPYLSERLFAAQQYWVDAYRRAQLRNVTDGTRIVRMEPARVISDKHYDAVTLRVFASGLDYTVDDHGKRVSGSDSAERAYSEYWTLIRGATRTGAARTDGKCPNCGADLKINMAGQCEFCSARLTAGEFDWVLSQIEQDEVYAG